MARSTKKTTAPSADTHGPTSLSEISKLGRTDLQRLYLEVLGVPATSCNVMHLRGVVARALLSRAGQLVPEAAQAAIASAEPVEPARDARLPAAGSVLRREHAGVVHRVKVLERAFVYQGAQYRSLSAVARAITGTTWNGFVWFGLSERAPKKGRAA
ncbi:MAG: DUF2924 domain-containing protein [Polyangiales bacterium]